jgi:hypothetical protein
MTQRWREDIRVEPQPRDEADMTANRGARSDRRETGVGDDHDLAIWHRFNAAVSFRQMMGELATVDAVAGHLDHCLQSNRSAARRNGNWKTASRDRRPKPAGKS